MIRLPRVITGGKPAGTFQVFDASINLNITPLSTASFTLAEGTTVSSMTYVEMFTPNGSAGIFRTRSPRSSYGGQNTTVELDHSIAALGDYLVNDTIEEETTLAAAIKKIFGYYKGGDWILGSIAKGSTRVILDVDHESCLDAILAVLEQEPSVMLAFSFAEHPWTVKVSERPTTVTAEGRLARNVKSATITTDDSELCTRVYMDKLPGATGNKYGYLDADTKSKYGIVEKTLSGSNYNATQAKRAAQLYLDKHKEPAVSIQINAIDLAAVTGETLDKFEIGKKMRLALPDFGVTVEETITQISWSSVYRNPSSVTVTLSEEEEQVFLTIAETAKSASRGSARANSAVQESNDYWEARVSKVVDDEGNIKSASIVLAINEDGSSECKLDADKVYIGNEKSTTVIKGKLNTKDLYAQISYLKSVLVKTLEATSINADTVKIRPIAGMGAINVATAYNGATIKSTGNTYTLSLMKMNGQKTELSFSRATSLSGTWSGGSYTVTASPQGNTIGTTIGKKSESWSGTTGTISVGYEDPISGNMIATGCVFTVTAPSVTHSPTIDYVWKSSSVPSSGTFLNTLKTVYEDAKSSNDYYCVRVKCGTTTKTYYCKP